MATSIPAGYDKTLPAAADMSADQFKFVTVTNNGGQPALARATAADVAVGVLLNAPEGAGYEAVYRHVGTAKVIVGAAALLPGQLVVSDADGLAVVAAANATYRGIVSTGAASGAVAEIILQTGTA